jgi:tetratricopeptide (TPR) repeat protein
MIFAESIGKGSQRETGRASAASHRTKLTFWQKLMLRQSILVTITASVILAFCTQGMPKTLDSIENQSLRNYTISRLEAGAPSLSVTARVEYRKALDLIDRGDWRGAEKKLLLAADISGNYADPLFTLARIELLHGRPDFLAHAIEGIIRACSAFPSQAYLALNAATVLLASLFGALFTTLVALLVKYWQLINHKMIELYRRRFSVPPARLIVLLICVGLLLLRLGLALYCAILVVALWIHLTKKEKGVVVTLMVLLSVFSFGSRYANCLAPAVDPGSVTRRLALLNERAVDEECFRSIEGIGTSEFRGERSFAIGTMLYRLGDYDHARDFLLDAVSVRPDMAPAFLNLGNVYFMQGDYDRALAGYQSSIQLDSTNVATLYNIGQSYIKKLLFGQSGIWLERANAHGIDRYRTAHPGPTLRNATIYEAGFEPGELWAIARRESAARTPVLLGEVMRPYLLFPFQYLWILFVVSLVAAIIAARKMPETWKVIRCDSCQMPTCPVCADTQFEITLCQDCASVVRGLSSVKVMEALLRHRRQKIATLTGARYRWKKMLFPGMALTYHGKTFGGVMLSIASVAACVLLASNGSPFKDPALVNMPSSLWKIVGPIAILAVGALLSWLAKPPKDPRNYRILPPEMRLQEQEREKPEAPPELQTSPQVEESPVFAGIGDIEKGSKWH